MKKRDYEAAGLKAPDYFDNEKDSNFDDGFYFPTDYHVPTPEDEEFWEDSEEDDDEFDEDDEEEYDDPSSNAHCGDWEDEPENCACCADDECPLNRS